MKNYKENGKILIKKMQENQNFQKHACQNTVAMETSNSLDQDMSYQIVARYILRKVAKFGGIHTYPIKT